ncbi:rhodanese-like domain-containing protein [Nitratifractor salsuginis]|uniref:Rhodanese domain protein n=1 Tax=Nitratifractor salsuginis (strain DSM 16511 / JCM 12458 / E9I37-1) TaxID=749222 RepID=E6X2N0_NITSE|nr:rhodanese-like domain-containing protein [Nitratifractor salsuginis]ADV46096.1 Rhodanese domain protein [Nitratifractor salsuginis DSM 16511]
MRVKSFVFLILFGLAGGLIAGSPSIHSGGVRKALEAHKEALHTWRNVDLKEVKRRYDTHSALFIDARAFPRYQKGTIPRALNVPLRRFKRMSKWLPIRRDAPLLVFCDGPKCGLAKKVAQRLVKAGYSNVLVYRGGYPEWKRHNLPIMAAPRPCPSQGYRPSKAPVYVEGVKLYPDPEDETRLDARWIAPLLEKGRFPKGLKVVDVRQPSAYARGHLPGALNFPFDEEKMELNVSALPKKGPILFTCKHGSISADAWFSLPEELQKRVFVIDADVVCEGEKCTVTPH